MRIDGVSGSGSGPASPGRIQSAGHGDDFAKQLMDALKEVSETQADSEQLRSQFLAGQPVDLHNLMFSMEKASTAMQLTMQVRNKVLEAYQEIMRMQV